MGELFASSVGACFKYAKTLWKTYFAFGSPFACAVEDSLTNATRYWSKIPATNAKSIQTVKIQVY